MNPTLIFEILSPSTQLIDRNRKREQYMQIPSMQGYFLVAQDQPLIEAYTRQDADWQYHVASGLDAKLLIPRARMRDSARIHLQQCAL